jgi:Flp pilus assembly pilin Flp
MEGLPLRSLAERVALEESGMETVEWALVGLLFAVVAAPFFGTIGAPIGQALAKVGTLLSSGGAGN